MGDWITVTAPSATGRRGAVAAAHPAASGAGLAVLRAGGNAIDAAVTTAFTLTVVEPFASGALGGGFMTVRLADGRAATLDFRETAPAAMKPTTFIDAEARGLKRADDLGYLPIGVPGALAGLAEALTRWGTISLARALAPAIAHAEVGFAVTPFMAEIMRLNRTRIGLTEDGRRTFLTPDGKLPEPGWLIRQPELAATYRRIAAAGPDWLYRGELGHAVAAQMAANGGLITERDLADYRTVLREPIRGAFGDCAIISAPPPSSGGFVLAMLLQLWAELGVADLPANSATTVHRQIEAMKLAFADREAHAGDPAFVDAPIARLMSADYIKSRAQLVDPAKPMGRATTGVAPAGSDSTTHLSVIDGEGNAVALTQTLQDLFGSGVMVAGTGLMLNNELRDFATKDPASPNSPQPGKRPLSSMSPTIIVRDGQPALVLGSAASKRIITAVAQVVMNHVGRGWALAPSVAAPRYHCDDLEVSIERSAPVAVTDGLRQLGHVLKHGVFPGPVDPFLGGVQAVGRAPDGQLTAVCDPRRAGTPAAE